ncbi:MAG: transposase [bacterium]
MLLDDTPREKSGRKMKGVGKYYNYAKNYFYLGYELVVLALVLGHNLLPLNFMPRQAKIKKRKPKKTRNSQSKLRLALKLITAALVRGIKANYLVFDRWYFALWFVRRLRE